MAVLTKHAHEVCNPIHGRGERREVANLRADVNAYARRLQISGFRDPAVKFARFADRHAKLVLVQPR